ncbi:NUDIX hydrolase [Endomicrobiia bacterium]|nr:NUDIX hydrolase [Endomicrobiia bacterium]
MLKEFSCGAVIYKIENDNPVFLLVRSKRNGKWGFSKGHVENGENEIETARREIFEEVGIKKIKFLENFRKESVYAIRSNLKGIPAEKHSIYFLALALEDPSDFDTNEIAEIKWTDINHAQELFFFTSQKEIINSAYKLIMGEENYG